MLWFFYYFTNHLNDFIKALHLTLILISQHKMFSDKDLVTGYVSYKPLIPTGSAQDWQRVHTTCWRVRCMPSGCATSASTRKTYHWSSSNHEDEQWTCKGISWGEISPIPPPLLMRMFKRKQSAERPFLFFSFFSVFLFFSLFFCSASLRKVPCLPKAPVAKPCLCWFLDIVQPTEFPFYKETRVRIT